MAECRNSEIFGIFEHRNDGIPVNHYARLHPLTRQRLQHVLLAVVDLRNIGIYRPHAIAKPNSHPPTKRSLDSAEEKIVRQPSGNPRGTRWGRI